MPNSRNLGWREAIIEVLKDSDEPLHYGEIARRVEDRGLRLEKCENPANSVSATFSLSFQHEGESSPFVKVSRGIFGLRGKHPCPETFKDASGSRISRTATLASRGLVQAFGTSWLRKEVDWGKKPLQLLGHQMPYGMLRNFAEDQGIYVLHDAYHTVYYGRTTRDIPFGTSLLRHTSDDLGNRWNRFSWVSFGATIDSEDLHASPEPQLSLETLLETFDAVLQTLVPPDCRKLEFRLQDVEFYQQTDFRTV